MKFKTYKSRKKFGIIAEAYDLQGNEEIKIVFILFSQAFNFLFEPKKRLVKHFEFRLPATAIINYGNSNVKEYKTKIFSWT